MSAKFNLDTLQLGAKIPMGKCKSTLKVEQIIDIQCNSYEDNDVMRLLMCDIQPEVYECEMIETGIYVKGNVRVQAFGTYVCKEDENALWNVLKNIPFETVVKCDNYLHLSNPTCKTSVRISSSDVKVNNKQSLNVVTSLAITAKVFEKRECGLVCGATEEADLRTKIKSMPIHMFEGEFQETTKIEDKLILPQAKPAIDKIVLSRYNLGSYNVKQNNEMFDVTGEVNVCIVYLADETSDVEELLQCCEFSVPFDLSVLAEVATGVECIPTISINDFNTKVAEDEDGEYREIDVEMEVNAAIECYNNVDVEVVDDVFCIGNRVKMSVETLALERVAKEHLGSIPCIKGIEIGESESGSPQEILISFGKVRDYSLMLKDEKPILTGTAEARVVYSVCDDRGETEYKSVTVEIPFQQEIDGCQINDTTDFLHTVDVKNCRSIMTMGNVLETKLDVVYNVTETQRKDTTIPVGVEEDDVSGADVATWMNSDNEIIMYVVKENDDVWNIAKRFLVAPENILNIEGEQVDDGLIAGSRVFIV